MNTLGNYVLAMKEAQEQLLRQMESDLEREVRSVQGVTGVGQSLSEVNSTEVSVAIRFFTHRALDLDSLERRFDAAGLTDSFDPTDGIPDVGEYYIRELEAPGIWGVMFCEAMSG